jgi:DGQHR domain-containing protein
MKEEHISEIEIPIMKITQPLGDFYIGKAIASDVIQICSAPIRKKILSDELDKYIGIQRELNQTRTKELVKFVQTSDASFPNSIILAVKPGQYRLEKDKIFIKIDKESCNIIDGQHRLAGFEPGYNKDFELILTLFLDLSLEYQSYIFSIINTRSTRINPSLAQDLYQFSQLETPEKLANRMARVFNKTEGSPWFQMIKILGKSDDDSKGILSQSSFCKPIIDLISNRQDSYVLRDNLKSNGNKRKALLKIYPDAKRKKNYPLWESYCNEEDKYIYDLLKAYFIAVKSTFESDWGNSQSILTKTTGYNAIMAVLKEILKKEGLPPHDQLNTTFSDLYTKAKASKQIKSLTSDPYNPGGQGESLLKNHILKGMGYL